MKIINLVGARPQFVKAAVVSKAIKQENEIQEIIVHTGQHYDKNLSETFFKELEIPEPDFNLEVGSGSHGKQTALMLERFEEVLLKEKPDWVILYGDTNSTVAGALAASKLHIKIAHVEAGLRSYNKLMPEEINRIATDHISDLLFAPSQNAMDILKKEGLEKNSVFSGDVMYDSVLFYEKLADEKYDLSDLTDLNEFYLATVHRQENTDDPERLQNIFSVFSELDVPVILPLHPRTKSKLNGIKYSGNVRLIDPVGYLNILLLLKNCKKVLTDSGGLQKEAYFLKKPCITLRDETEWIETLNNNWNFIVGTNQNLIQEKIAIDNFGEHKNYYGDGKSGINIINTIKQV